MAKKKKSSRLSRFISKVTIAEGKKKSVSIGNVREVLKIANKLLGGKLYQLINKE